MDVRSYEFDYVERLKQLRLARDWSVNRLANESGLSQSYLRNVELRKCRMTIDQLAHICCAFGISLPEFFQEKQPSGDAWKIYELSLRLPEEKRAALLALLETLV